MEHIIPFKNRTLHILSDLHVDSYFFGNLHEIPEREIEESFVKRHFQGGDILIVAGDISEILPLTAKTFKVLSCYYNHIVAVAGNHDLYLWSEYERQRYGNSFKKLEAIGEELSRINVHFLDGSIVEIDGIRFGGCMGWYDGSYFMKTEHIDKHLIQMRWSLSIIDAMFITIERFDEPFEKELEKIEKIYKQVDVMITHINPLSESFAIHEDFKSSSLNGFFCFDGERFIREGSMNLWVFGHTHRNYEYKHGNTQCVCNALGYSV